MMMIMLIIIIVIIVIILYNYMRVPTTKIGNKEDDKT